MNLLQVTLVFAIVSCCLGVVTPERGVVGQEYSGSTESGRRLSVYEYHIEKKDVVRINLNSNDANESIPLLAVFRQPSSIVSVQSPVNIKNFLYNNSAVTLCPYHHTYDHLGKVPITVELSSFLPVHYDFSLDLVEDFHLKTNENYSLVVSTAEPVLYQYEFSEDDPSLDSIVIWIDSNDTVCMTVSIQVAECPVFDLEQNIKSKGMHQVVTTSGSITVLREHYEKFFLIFMVRPHDDFCDHRREVNLKESVYSLAQEKNFTFIVNSAPKATLHHRVIFSTIGVASGVFLLGILLIWMWACFEYTSLEDAVEIIEKDLEREPVDLSYSLQNEDNIKIDKQVNERGEMVDDELLRGPNAGTTEEEEEPEDKRPFKERFVASACYFKNYLKRSFGNMGKLHLFALLSEWITEKRRKSKVPFEEYDIRNHYTWSLISIAFYYALPAVQLMLTWQNNHRNNGDLDLCWHNFRCARPLTISSWVFYAFNNFFSNVFYVMFGMLLIFIVWLRGRIFQKLAENHATVDLENVYGMPRHRGIMYSVGLAIIMQGILSASYHICPSSRNFQFDNTFMYVMGILGMLKIHQLRHSNKVAEAHKAFSLVALAIFASMLGVYFNTHSYMNLFVIVYLNVMIMVSGEFYFHDEESSSTEKYFKVLMRISLFFRSFITDFRATVKTCFHFVLSIVLLTASVALLLFQLVSHPMIFLFKRKLGILQKLTPRELFKAKNLDINEKRFNFLVFANVVNIGIIVAGMQHLSHDIPTFILFLTIVNFLLYLAYFLLWKTAHGENASVSAKLFFLIGLVLWINGLLHYRRNVSMWAQSPATSRSYNRECVLFSFYDNHDIWHILSAVALFFSFAAIECLDDDLLTVRRDKIEKF